MTTTARRQTHTSREVTDSHMKDESSRPLIPLVFINSSALMKMSQALPGKFPISTAENAADESKYLCLLKNKQCSLNTGRLTDWRLGGSKWTYWILHNLNFQNGMKNG